MEQIVTANNKYEVKWQQDAPFGLLVGFVVGAGLGVVVESGFGTSLLLHLSCVQKYAVTLDAGMLSKDNFAFLSSKVLLSDINP